MSTRYKITNPDALYFVTLTVVDWVDVFIRKRYKDIIIESLKYCQKEKGLVIYAYVIMSSHVHLVINSSRGIPLTDILRDFKKFTAKTILTEIDEGKQGYESRRAWLLHRFAYRARTSLGTRRYQFWKSDNHPVELYSLPFIAQKVGYIHKNPLVEGWVSEAHHYPYSSASNYYNGKGLLAVEVIDFPMSWVGFVQT